MTLTYVAGSAGSGKSALAVELQQLGMRTYDEDDPAIGSAHEIRTGQPVKVPAAEERSPTWFNRHEWRLRDDALEVLRRQARGRLVLLFGNAYQPAAATSMFDRVIYLDVDEETIRRRIERRVENDYGKTPPELERILDNHRRLRDECDAHSIDFVDATAPLPDVASAIVRAATAE